MNAPEHKPDDRQSRFVDTSADHVRVGPKTAEALKAPKTMEELDALIPVVEDEEEGQEEEE